MKNNYLYQKKINKMAKKQSLTDSSMDELFAKLRELANETKGFVFTLSFGKKNQAWNFYVFSHKQKIENVDLKQALIDTITFVEEKRTLEEGQFKL